MTMKDLLKYFEEFYGEKYTGTFLDTMIEYLTGWSEKFYQETARVVILRFSRIYNKVPDPAIIEKNMDEIRSGIPRCESLPEPVREIATTEEVEYFINEMKQITGIRTGGKR